MRGLTAQQQHAAADHSGDRSVEDQLRDIARAVERGDEAVLTEGLHRLCFDAVGIPLTRSLRISPPASCERDLHLTQDHLGPFAKGLPDGAFDAASRIRMAAQFDLFEIDQALALPDLQPSVRQALEARRRRLASSNIERSGTG